MLIFPNIIGFHIRRKNTHIAMKNIQKPMATQHVSKALSLFSFLSLNSAFLLTNSSKISSSIFLLLLHLCPSIAPTKTAKLSLPVNIRPSMSSTCMLTSLTCSSPPSLPPQVTTTANCTGSPTAAPATLANRSCIPSVSQCRRASTAAELATLIARLVDGLIRIQLTRN